MSVVIHALAFHDDYNAVSYVSLMKKKSELFNALERFKAHTEIKYK